MSSITGLNPEKFDNLTEGLTAPPLGTGADNSAARRFEDIARLVSDWIWETDAEYCLTFASLRLMDLVGIHPMEVRGQKLEEIGLSAKTPTSIDWKKPFRDQPFEMIDREGETRHFLISSLPVFCKTTGTFLGLRGTARDVTQQRSDEARLLQLANYDSLTGLPNRILTLDRLAQAVARAQRTNKSVGLFFIDLDRFKKVNDTLGHAAGDSLLEQVGKRLSSSIRKSDTVGRLGGDEFLVILPDLRSTEVCETVAQKIVQQCNTPYRLLDQEVVVTASLGITVFPNDGADIEGLVRNADAAMYRSKIRGKNTFRFFAPGMDALAREHLALENRMRIGLKQDSFQVHYQPIVDATSGRLRGFEALARWTDEELGPQSPEKFIRVAEDSGLIIPLGEKVLHDACRHGANAIKRLGYPITTAVNISAHQITGGRLVETVETVLAESGLPTKCLELEITEGVLLEDAPKTSETLGQLSRLGVSLSIDDFGTGYSSLSYLKKFPFDTLKIDKSFIRDILEQQENAALTSAIIAMAHGLGLKVIGEGVETEEHRKLLRKMGCDMLQGYHFGHPMTEQSFAKAWV